MNRACMVPESHEEDLTSAMATTLRVNGMTFSGSVDDIEERAFNILWRNPSARGGYSYAEIKPRLTFAWNLARELGPIDLEAAGA